MGKVVKSVAEFQKGDGKMKELNLMLHCGAHEVERNVIDMAPTPEATDSWVPIPHAELLGRVEETVTRGGMWVVNQAHGLTHDGDRYFGMLQVANGKSHEDYGLVIGVRNSHDKTFPAALCLGAGVFVCDNLSFSGEVKLARRHTRFVRRDLPQVINRAVGMLTDHRQKQDVRIEAYKECPISDQRSHDIVINALDCGAVPATKIPHVLKEYRNPQHEEFRRRTVWSLFNAFTEVLKGDARKALPRTQALHGLMDSVCQLSV
jgi:hypothetical protein